MSIIARNDNYQFKDWYIETKKDRIMASRGEVREKFEKSLDLPHLPDMLFADNVLRLVHKDGFGIEFKAYDSLTLVDPKADLIKVSVAKEWKESRVDCEYIDKLVHPFDWTFTTSYKGTLIGTPALAEFVTEERINMEKLKIPETILFFDEISLFDDELSDHGIASLNIKIRVMPSGFYILQRFFLRVDGVVLRVNDTRIYHETGKDYLLREYSERESLASDLKCPKHLQNEPNAIAEHLELKSSQVERLEFPKAKTAVSTEANPDT